MSTRYNILEFCDGVREGAPVPLREVPSERRDRAQQVPLFRPSRLVPRGRVVGQQEGRLPLHQPKRHGRAAARRALLISQRTNPLHYRPLGATGIRGLRRSASAPGASGGARPARPPMARPTIGCRSARSERGLRSRNHLLRHGERLRRRSQRGTDRRVLRGPPRDKSSSRPRPASRHRIAATISARRRCARRSRAACDGCDPTMSICSSSTTAVPNVVMGDPEIVELMQRLVAEGKVRCWGISTLSPEDALALVDVAGVGVLSGQLQPVGLACDRCRIARPRRVAGHRRSSPARRSPRAFSPEPWPRTRCLLPTIIAADGNGSESPPGSRPPSAVAEAANVPDTAVERAALALRFCLSVEGVATVIPGMLTRTEVLASVAACEQGPLEPDVMRSIEGTYRRYEARLGF